MGTYGSCWAGFRLRAWNGCLGQSKGAGRLERGHYELRHGTGDVDLSCPCIFLSKGV